LLAVLRWLIIDLAYSGPLDRQWADLGRLPVPPRTLPERIRRAAEIYPCDVLFVHRDAEAVSLSDRKCEVVAAVREAFPDQPPPAVCVVPVRMMEAWLLFDEIAVRRAAGRPSFQHPLAMPDRGRMEALADPKETLHRLLVEASGTSGRKRRRFPVEERVHRLADLIEDYSPLRALPAFRELEQDLRTVLREHGWI
jgi:hypothetical protein